VSVEQANAEIQLIARQLMTEFPQTNPNWDASVEPLQNDFIPKTTIRNLWLLLGAVSFLLLIGCVNTANLLLARATVRQREVAIRAALGATRGQIFGQFLTESLMLAVVGGACGVYLGYLIIKGILVGGACGVYLGYLIIKGILAILPSQMLPSEADVRLSVPVLLFTIAASVLTGLLFGCVPAWKASRLDLNDALKEGGRANPGSAGRGLRRTLVVVEFALALTLLATGGLALRSFWNLTRVDLGVRTDHILTFLLPVPRSRFPQPERITPYYRQMLERIESVPGVESAALTTGLPLLGMNGNMPFRIAGAPPLDEGARQNSGIRIVTPGYFQTFGIRMIRGRPFTMQDSAEAIRVAVVNETFAKKFLSDADALAQRIILRQIIPFTNQPGPDIEWQIVGVYHDTRDDGLRNDVPPVILLPYWQSPSSRCGVAVRTMNDPLQISRSLALAINSVDPDVPLAGVKTMDQVLNESLSFDRFGTVLYGSFAGLALLLAGIGIYGVMAFGVAQRTHEFGVRMALGAGEGRILRLVLREGLFLALLGMGIGLIGAYLGGRAMQSMLFGVGALDAAAFSLVAGLLLGAALLACYIPARRASRVDPMIALRYE
jgi:predicted permease